MASNSVCVGISTKEYCTQYTVLEGYCRQSLMYHQRDQPTLSREPCTLRKEPYISRKQPYTPSTWPTDTVKSPRCVVLLCTVWQCVVCCRNVCAGIPPDLYICVFVYGWIGLFCRSIGCFCTVTVCVSVIVCVGEPAVKVMCAFCTPSVYSGLIDRALLQIDKMYGCAHRENILARIHVQIPPLIIRIKFRGWNWQRFISSDNRSRLYRSRLSWQHLLLW